jgi:hypothetical protein
MIEIAIPPIHHGAYDIAPLANSTFFNKLIIQNETKKASHILAKTGTILRPNLTRKTIRKWFNPH